MKMNEHHTFEDYAKRRVSFILTTRNKEAFLPKALENIRKFLGPNDELIVIDGASTDRTREIIEQHRDLVTLFVSEPDITPTHALNKGILLSSGKYIKQIPDDDDFFPDAMEKAIQVLESNPEIDVLICGGARQLGDEIYPFYIEPGVNFGKSPEDVFRYGVCGCGFIIRRSSFARTGLANCSLYGTDGEFIAQAIRSGANVKFCRINLFHHRLYPHSVVIANPYDYKRAVDEMIRRQCSGWFYIKHRLKQMIIRNLLLHKAALFFLGTKSKRVKNLQIKPLWDGGFS